MTNLLIIIIISEYPCRVTWRCVKRNKPTNCKATVHAVVERDDTFIRGGHEHVYVAEPGN